MLCRGRCLSSCRGTPRSSGGSQKLGSSGQMRYAPKTSYCSQHMFIFARACSNQRDAFVRTWLSESGGGLICSQSSVCPVQALAIAATTHIILKTSRCTCLSMSRMLSQQSFCQTQRQSKLPFADANTCWIFQDEAEARRAVATAARHAFVSRTDASSFPPPMLADFAALQDYDLAEGSKSSERRRLGRNSLPWVRVLT